MLQIAGVGYYQENSPLITYTGRWNRVQWGPARGAIRETADPYASAAFSFYGSGVIFHTLRGERQVAPAIFIDGRGYGQYDLSAAIPPEPTQLVFDNLPLGYHTILVQSLDAGYLSVDGFEVIAVAGAPAPTAPASTSGTVEPSIADQITGWARSNPLLAAVGAFLGARLLLRGRLF